MWRALLYLQRLTRELAGGQRRWRRYPETIADIAPYVHQMIANGELEGISDQSRLYRVTAPFAAQTPLDAREVLFEAHPWAILSHLSALEFHGLTLDQPKIITAFSAVRSAPDLLPLGTITDDWLDTPLPSKSRPRTVLGLPVRWVDLPPERVYGIAVHAPLGVPYRVTSPERTLVDALQRPDLSGGIGNVLRAWGQARDLIEPAVVEQYTERYGVALLRQRVGFVLEHLGHRSVILDQWAEASTRGGSNRLVGPEPFSSDYSERWNLSLNAPVHLLAIDGT